MKTKKPLLMTGLLASACPHGSPELSMDNIDKKILSLLQQDATASVASIAEKVGLSSTPCWRRIQNLEAAGIIRGRVALLDPKKMNVGVTVFIAIRTNRHSADWLQKFQSAVDGIPEIVEFYRMSGDIDYLLRAVVPDIAAYDSVYKRLIQRVELADVTSMFAMETIRSTTVLPVSYAD
jgi:Lrp/AsnC family transcriptional regulator